MNSSREAERPQKFQTLRRLMEDDFFFIHVDTAQAGLEMPAHLLCEKTVTFKLSLQYVGAPEVTAHDVRANLLFGTVRHQCIFPLDAIWGATSASGSTILWPASEPDELPAHFSSTPPPPQPGAHPKRVKPKAAKLVRAKPSTAKLETAKAEDPAISADSDPQTVPQTPTGDKPKNPARPFLKRIK
jgi:hypothetical protein